MRLSGGKKPVIITTKLYCYHSVIINVIEINRNQTLSGMIRNKHNYIGWQYLATALLGMLQ